jgi:putative FmdB family regulatory protein
MPLYEYECDACGHRFEVIQKFSDPPLEACPKCGSRIRKLLAPPAIQFKGSGWYITDYAKKPEAATGEKAKDSAATKDSSSTTEGGGKGEKTADSATPASSSSSGAQSTEGKKSSGGAQSTQGKKQS